MKNKLLVFGRKLSPHRWKIVAALALFWCAKWWWDGVQLIGPIPAPGPPKIVFSTIIGEIRSMNLDGSEEKVLAKFSHNPSLAGSLAIRPDRRKIAFTASRLDQSSHKESVWVMNIDGTKQKRITPWGEMWGGEAGMPEFTPEERNIVFDYCPSVIYDGGTDFYAVNSKGKRWRYIGNSDKEKDRIEVKRLLNPQGPWVNTQIARPGQNLIWPPSSIIHADDRAFPLPKIANDGRSFSLSPDRTQFVFYIRNGQIYRINSDGTGLAQLTNDFFSTNLPKFTPDGRQIVFIGGTFKRNMPNNVSNDLYIMNANGTNQRQLTNTPQNEEWFDVR